MIGTLMLVLLVSFGLFSAKHTESKTASAATSSSKVYTIAGRVESTTGSLSSIDVSDNFTVTMESTNASGTGTLEQNAKLNWTYVIFKVNVQKILFHLSFLLEKNGENFYSNTLSGKESLTLYSGSLPDGNYRMCYQFGVREGITQYTAVNYVFTFSIDTTPPKDSLTADGNRLENGSVTNKRVKYSAEDPNFKYIYFKKSRNVSYSSTSESTFEVEPTSGNTGEWFFYSVDELGNKSDERNVTLDFSLPSLSCGEVDFGKNTGRGFTVKATKAVGTAKLYVKFESEEWFTMGDSYTVQQDDKNGRYYFYAEDTLGNRSETKWIVLSTEEPVGRFEKSDYDNYVTFVWDSDYWSATLDGRTYLQGKMITSEGTHILILTDNAGKQRTYQFTIDHYYIVIDRDASTCLQNGTVTYECSQCGDRKEEEVYATGHQYQKRITEGNCTEQSTVTYVCSVCGDSYSESGDFPEGHSFTVTVTKQATCDEDGTRHYVCDKCGYAYDSTIHAYGHNYYISDESNSDGVTVRNYTCSQCGSTYTQELGDQYVQVTNYVEYLFDAYSPYMFWVLLATAGVWSIAIGIAIIIAVRNDEKVKARKMLVNYLIGLVVIAAIVVACPYLVRGIASLVG